MIPSPMLYTENHFYANIIFMLFSLSNNKTEKFFRVISHAHTAPHSLGQFPLQLYHMMQ